MFDDFDEWDEPDDLFSHENNPPKLYSPPQATMDYIQLRFQLPRFKVYRIVRLPRSFTFANLHTLIQYMFGWSDSHLHRAEVFPNAVLHDEEQLVGTIKSCGRRRPLEDRDLADERLIADWRLFEPEDKPIYRIQPKVKDRKDKIDGIMKMEEKGVTLESIWTPNEAQNVSDGQCSNAQIAVIYTYDFGDEWYVHITCERDDIFHRLDSPSNLPIFRDARGAPPVEHATFDAFLLPDSHPEDKKVSPRLFDVSYFQGYCDGKVTSEARKTRLEILTLKEGEARYKDSLRKQKERQERFANGEADEGEDEDEEYEDSEDEYEGFEG